MGAPAETNGPDVETPANLGPEILSGTSWGSNRKC